MRRINATLAWQHALRLVLSAAPRAVEPNQPVRLQLLRSEAFLYTPVSMHVKPGALCEAEIQIQSGGIFNPTEQARSEGLLKPLASNSSHTIDDMLYEPRSHYSACTPAWRIYQTE